jgi:hypothetical protein
MEKPCGCKSESLTTVSLPALVFRSIVLVMCCDRDMAGFVQWPITATFFFFNLECARNVYPVSLITELNTYNSPILCCVAGCCIHFLDPNIYMKVEVQ